MGDLGGESPQDAVGVVVITVGHLRLNQMMGERCSNTLIAFFATNRKRHLDIFSLRAPITTRFGNKMWHIIGVTTTIQEIYDAADNLTKGALLWGLCGYGMDT